MSLLVIKLPPRPRPRHRAGSGGADKAAALKLPSEWAYVFSADGRQAGPLAQAPAALLPRADEVVLLLEDADVSWHRVRLPVAPAARLRAALAGVMEEVLLEDDEAAHLALGPGALPGQAAWVAVTHRPRLAAALQALEAADRVVHRVVPSSQPMTAALDGAGPGAGAESTRGPLRGHFSLHPSSLLALRAGPGLALAGSASNGAGVGFAAGVPTGLTTDLTTALSIDLTTDAATNQRADALLDKGAASGAAEPTVPGDGAQLSLALTDGVYCLPLPALTAGAAAGTSSLVQRLVQASRGPTGSAGDLGSTGAEHWTTTPAAALAAEQILGRPVSLQTDAEHALECARREINLRQFGLLRRSQGLRALGDLGRQLRSVEWRWLRAGALALLALQLLGLNAYAWQQEKTLLAQRSALSGLLRQTHPTVRTVLDAPAQMAGETDRLRAAAGQPGAADLEVMLAAAAAGWPAGKEPVTALQFETGRLSLAASGWREDEVQAFTQRLAAAGWTATRADNRVVVTRSAATANARGSTSGATVGNTAGSTP